MSAIHIIYLDVFIEVVGHNIHVEERGGKCIKEHIKGLCTQVILELRGFLCQDSSYTSTVLIFPHHSSSIINE